MTKLPAKVTLSWSGDTTKRTILAIVTEAYCTRTMAYELTRAFFEGCDAGVAHRKWIESVFDDYSLSNELLGGHTNWSSPTYSRELLYEGATCAAHALIEPNF